MKLLAGESDLTFNGNYFLFLPFNLVSGKYQVSIFLFSYFSFPLVSLLSLWPHAHILNAIL